MSSDFIPNGLDVIRVAQTECPIVVAERSVRLSESARHQGTVHHYNSINHEIMYY